MPGNDPCPTCGEPWKQPHGRIRVEHESSDDLYWALHRYTSDSIGDKILVREAGGDTSELRDRLRHLHRLRDELKRLYVEMGWEWPGND